MEALSRSEYPAMLAHLPPAQAVQVLQERVRRIAKINTDIADFLAERRRVEDQYVAGLKKLAAFKSPSNAAELGVFQPSWDAILRSIDTIANSHQQLSTRIDKDVESALRHFQSSDDMANMNTISANLQTLAKELDEAQAQADKLGRKGGKANTHKVESATLRLESAAQLWDAQAPFIFETLQALDEKRTNHLRDVLTQLETHEVDQASRSQASAEAMLNLVLEIRTEDEISTFAQRTVQNRPRIERRAAGTRQSSIAGSVAGPTAVQVVPPPATPTREEAPSAAATPASRQASGFAEERREAERREAERREAERREAERHEAERHAHAGHPEKPPEKQEKKLRSRIGTMLSRRRQSIHGGFGQLASGKGAGPFNRISVSSHGQAISPRASYNNLPDSNRLGSLAENPDASPVRSDANGIGGPPSRTGTASSAGGVALGRNGGTGSTGGAGSTAGTGGVGVADIHTLNTMSVDDIFGVPPPPGPPPQQQQQAPARDAEGFSVPAAANDPISVAQREAAAASGEHLGGGGGDGSGGGDDQAFKLSIQNEPVPDEDPQAKQAALSSVANTLSLGMPTRKGGTVRGRRDVRNTIYMPAPPPSLPESSSASASASASSSAVPGLPPVSRGPTATPTKPSAVAALVSEGSLASDTQSVRSSHSLGALAHTKHIDSARAGLHASIIETVSATLRDGAVQTAKVAGEVAFSYTAPAGTSTSASETATVRIDNFAALEAIGPNRIFVANTARPDEFTLDTSHLQAKATVGFTFRVHADDDAALAAHCPVLVKPDWRPAGDKLGLLLQYRLNPAARLAGAGPLVLRNVYFIAHYEGARASGVQTKPTGTHLKDRHLVYWKFAELTLTDAWAKIVCRVVGDQGAEPQPGPIDMRWDYAVPADAGADAAGGVIGLSQLVPGDDAAADDDDEQDPFADDSQPSPKPANGAGAASWSDVPVARQIASGKYEAR